MNCEKCQELLSDYIDGELAIDERHLLSAHLEECLACYTVRDDLKAILGFCQEHRGEYDEVPNSRAMWVRIRNTIEMDGQFGQNTIAPGLNAQGKESLWKRFGSASWQLSFGQLIATVSAIAIVVSIFTTVGIQRFRTSTDGTAASTTADVGRSAPDPDERIRQQQLNISYWNQRIEQRKARWSPQLRDAFDRNLGAVDRAVNDSRQQLKQNPHDEISEEMLNAALNEKMELLKDFSEQ